jgi:hypothetical protein
MIASRALSRVLLTVLLIGTTAAWVMPPKTMLNRPSPSDSKLNGFLDFLSPYESKIPEELKSEIYQAEANTPAAKDRSQRVALYALVAFIGVGCAFFNGFLTELRSNGPDGTAGVDLTEAGFGWVTTNFLFNFLFTNKIGGGGSLLIGAGSGLLAEAELDTKRINAEKIYEELERRRNSKTNPKQKKKASQKKASQKKRRSGKEKKRLAALSEVIVNETPALETAEASTTTDDVVQKEETEKEEEKKGLFGGIKDFYEKADSMAASQALLINKQLEDAGVVDKITDESGLKVIGKEAAEKLVKGDSKNSNSEKDE